MACYLIDNQAVTDILYDERVILILGGFFAFLQRYNTRYKVRDIKKRFHASIDVLVLSLMFDRAENWQRYEYHGVQKVARMLLNKIGNTHGQMCVICIKCASASFSMS